MINKQSLLFLALTSLILVLSVYYITMPNELLIKTDNSYVLNKEEVVNNDNVVIENVGVLFELRDKLSNERINIKKELNTKLLSNDLTVLEKNDIYEELKKMNDLESLELSIEKKIKELYEVNSFVKISDDTVDVIVNKKEGESSLVVKIMNTVNEIIGTPQYVSVTFKE